MMPRSKNGEVVTPQDIALIRSNFAQLHRRKIETACLFYERLFTTAPSTRALFKTDIEKQAAKLIETLTVALAMVNDPTGLNALLTRLGERHHGYGVRPAHYEAVRSALLWTLEQALREQFTPEVKQAWIKTYGVLSQTMRESALSPARQMEFLKLMQRMDQAGYCQVLMATHSPVLMAYPNATLLRLSKYGLEPVTVQDTDHFKSMREFCQDPTGFVEAALAE